MHYNDDFDAIITVCGIIYIFLLLDHNASDDNSTNNTESYHMGHTLITLMYICPLAASLIVM